MSRLVLGRNQVSVLCKFLTLLAGNWHELGQWSCLALGSEVVWHVLHAPLQVIRHYNFCSSELCAQNSNSLWNDQTSGSNNFRSLVKLSNNFQPWTIRTTSVTKCPTTSSSLFRRVGNYFNWKRTGNWYIFSAQNPIESCFDASA